MIGNDIPSLVRSARELQRYPIAAIDLNLGCPAPVVYRKCAGGGLLRRLDLVDSILGALRDAVTIPFTVKTRIGFDDPAIFENLLPILARHGLDLVTVHGRTVSQMYRGGIDLDRIALAVATLPCPVIANGNVDSAAAAQATLAATGARGLMIGRGAIANPWIFNQIRAMRHGLPLREPSGPELLDYIERLYSAVCTPDVSESSQVQRMKKYMNFIAARAGGICGGASEFLHEIRRVTTRADFFTICRRNLMGQNRPSCPSDG
jgi:tRNA-dihydrouridine synthase